MQMSKEMKMLAGTALGMMIFMVITGLTYIFGGVLKGMTGGSAAMNTTIDAILAVFVSVTGLITLIVLIQILRIVIKSFGNDKGE